MYSWEEGDPKIIKQDLTNKSWERENLMSLSTQQAYTILRFLDWIKIHAYEGFLVEHNIIEEEHVHLRKLWYPLLDSFELLNLYRPTPAVSRNNKAFIRWSFISKRKKKPYGLWLLHSLSHNY